MKTVIYMGQSLNGYITKNGDDTSFLTKASWNGFQNAFQKAGNLVMGRTTYDISVKEGTFPYKKALNVIMTHKQIKNKSGDIAVFTNAKPKEILKMLENRGFKTALIAGGGKINASFIEAGLADEIYVDIEPIIFGIGKPLLGEGKFENKLKLLDTKKLSKNEIQLHYKIIK